LVCGVIMARHGEGTPLPLDGPRRLVLAGPYGYVRNPMAIAGLGQGLCVGVGTGSWLVVAYALLGSAIWNWIVRPSEEEDLEHTSAAKAHPSPPTSVANCARRNRAERQRAISFRRSVNARSRPSITARCSRLRAGSSGIRWSWRRTLSNAASGART